MGLLGTTISLSKNIPAMFGHPVWSLFCDYKMFGLMLTGNMDKEITRLKEACVLNA
ncbi:hypothetical protein RchiOBHm_Chr4g0412041 [Rosa chinensis]|uniref:Uncharacterized protein n=1 Tax=Rosa chinensis TaxID=74649 RepID=A0A2P6QVT0_ROSCH|nr:hypothetical protein RchiOBHm_Chr4g0412041 [Rosa chinensis]